MQKQTYKVEYQQYPDGTHVCVALENGDWVSDCGLEGNPTAEDNAKRIVEVLNKAQEPSPILLSKERRLDMLTGAIEGGSNYWYYISGSMAKHIFNKTKDLKTQSFVELMMAAIERGLSVVIRDAEDPSIKLGKITSESFDAGEKLMFEKQPRHYADILSENDDSITADVWFQYVALKDLVYG